MAKVNKLHDGLSEEAEYHVFQDLPNYDWREKERKK